MYSQEANSANLLNKTELIKEIIQPVRRRTRFYNHMLDILFFYMIMLALGIILGGVLVFTGSGQNILESLPLFENLLSIIMYLAYYITFEGLFGRTIGKMVTNTKVVRLDGTKPSFNNIVGHSFARIIPFDAFSFLSPNPRGWHDTLSDTIVVKNIPLYNLEPARGENIEAEA